MVLPFIVTFLAMDVTLATLACMVERDPIVRTAVMIKNKSPNPAHVCLFRPHRIVIYAHHVADVIEQLARLQRQLGKLLFFP